MGKFLEAGKYYQLALALERSLALALLNSQLEASTKAVDEGVADNKLLNTDLLLQRRLRGLSMASHAVRRYEITTVARSFRSWFVWTCYKAHSAAVEAEATERTKLEHVSRGLEASVLAAETENGRLSRALVQAQYAVAHDQTELERLRSILAERDDQLGRGRHALLSAHAKTAYVEAEVATERAATEIMCVRLHDARCASELARSRLELPLELWSPGHRPPSSSSRTKGSATEALSIENTGRCL
jgi:hypothetical protein